MSELLRHYSNAPVEAVRSVEQNDRPHMKPRGFWISVDGGEDGWKEWCEGEGYALENLTHVHDVQLNDAAPICRITSVDDLLQFHHAYQVGNCRFDRYALDWSRVSRQFSGIIITPYLWSMRLDDECAWYYGWDCASGCIWDAAAIESVRLIEANRPVCEPVSAADKPGGAV